jgi:O-antigen ligase
MDGSPMYTGVGNQKNDLGLICFITGTYFLWKLLQKHKESPSERTSINDVALIGMTAWLLVKSDSQTAIACLLMVAALLLVFRTGLIQRKPSRLMTVSAVVVCSYVVLDVLFDVKLLILGLMGRDASITSRTEIWEVLTRQETNPLIGVGFMSFWQGERLRVVWDALGGVPLNQAHNGYVEQYLNLGYVGVAFIGILMFSALLKVRRKLDVDPRTGVLLLCFLSAAALYNYTEASFYGVNNMWLLLLLAYVDVSGQSETIALESVSVRPPAAVRGMARPAAHGTAKAFHRQGAAATTVRQ